MSIFDFKSTPKWTQLYCATRDGFSASDFHIKCDTFTRLLVVTKSTENEILGGYTNLNWKVDSYALENLFKHDEQAFVFRFEKTKLLKKSYKNEAKAVRCVFNKGPCFGEKDFTVPLGPGTTSTYDNYAFTGISSFSMRCFYLSELEVFYLSY